MSTEAMKLTGPTDRETLVGGTQVEISFRGGSPAAPLETVFVRQVNVEEYTNYLKAQDDEPVMIELFCGKPAGWAKTLTRKSHNAIVENGERINDDFFSAVGAAPTHPHGKAFARRYSEGNRGSTFRLAQFVTEAAAGCGLSLHQFMNP